MTKVFLGGTCANDDWRENMAQALAERGMAVFNPVVAQWDEAAQREELRERGRCDWLLYGITPAIEGVYAVAEVVDDSNKRPERTILMLLDFHEHPYKMAYSLDAVAKMVRANGASVFYDIEAVAQHMGGSNGTN